MKAKKVLTIGGATQDLFLHYDNPEVISLKKNDISFENFLILEEGSKIDVKEINCYSGGGSTNAGASFKRLGLDTTSFFKIGKDTRGKYILRELKKEGLKTKYSYSQRLPSAISFVLSTPSDRIILAYRGANADILAEEIPVDLIKKSNLIYITSLPKPASNLLFPIAELAKKNNVCVAANPGIAQLVKEEKQEIIKALKNIDILILNAQESQQLMSILISDKSLEFKWHIKTSINEQPKLFNHFFTYLNKKISIENYFELISSFGVSIIVITNGAEGVYVFNKRSIYFHKSFPIKKVVNTLGAGDAFGSCFVASLLKGTNIEGAIVNGMINSSSVIGSEGAKNGLLTWNQLQKKAKDIKIHMQIFQVD